MSTVASSVQYKLTDPIKYWLNVPDLPSRYCRRIFSLICVHGDYGIFSNPDRKKPFILPMSKLTRV